jgi:hypothetical protein
VPPSCARWGNGYRRHLRRDDIAAGKPVQNALVESLNGRFRDEIVNWTGFDEGDEIKISGSDSAELEDDGAIEIELSIHDGDDPILRAATAKYKQILLRRLRYLVMPNIGCLISGGRPRLAFN